MSDYAPPVRQLLTRGKPDWDADWKLYTDLGLGPEQMPELIRMATDRELIEWPGQGPEGWAPFHAAFALGQLQAVAAIEPLLDLFALAAEQNKHWGVLDEIIWVLEHIGPAGIPTLTAALTAEGNDQARTTVAEVLGKIAQKHPEVRPLCIDILTRQLEKAAQQAADLNAFIICSLLDLKAVEAAPVIERAFATGQVDEFIVGTLENTLFELGLRDQPPPRRPPLIHFADPQPIGSLGDGPRRTKDEAKARKAKRKQAEQSKKRNRKRK